MSDFLLFHFSSDQKALTLTAANTADDLMSDLNGWFLTLSLSPGFQLFPTPLTSDNMQQFAKDDECDIIVRLQSKSGGCPVSLNNCQVTKIVMNSGSQLSE